MSYYDENGHKFREVSRKSQVPRTVKKKQSRVEGDFIWYFFLHNIYSALFFASIGYILGVFEHSFLGLTDIFSLVFVDVLLMITLLMFIAGIFGRISAYITLKAVYNWRNLGASKKIGELNKGINKMTSISYLIAIILSALIFTLGIFPIIQSKIFGESTISTVILTYLIIKTVIFIIVRLFSNFKL